MATVGIEISNKPGRDGRHEIMFRITHQGKKSRIGTGIKVFKKSFNSKGKFGNWVRSSEQFCNRMNLSLKNDFVELQDHCLRFVKDNPNSSSHEIKNAYRDKGIAPGVPWLSYIEQVTNEYHDVGKHQFALKLKYIGNKFKAYLGDKVKLVEQTNIDLIRGFEVHLRSIGNSQNTIDKNIKTIKQLYRKAINDDVIINADLKVLGYKSKTVQVVRDKLTLEEIDRLETLEISENTMLWHSRNLFMFSFYCAGMRFTDVITLRGSSIIEKEYLRYRMSKTKKLQTLKLPKQAMVILGYYHNKPKRNNRDLVFPILSDDFHDFDPTMKIKKISSKNALINYNLKIIARMAKIEKNVSFHTARHSFAYVGFKQTKDVVAIQTLLQHSKLKETQDYITSLTNEKERDILGEIFKD